LQTGAVPPQSWLGKMQVQEPLCEAQTPLSGHDPPQVGQASGAAQGDPMAASRLASEQSAIAGAGASRAVNLPGSSRTRVPGPNTAQLRRVPVVIRIATVPSGLS
jgi:hypothetical protein